MQRVDGRDGAPLCFPVARRAKGKAREDLGQAAPLLLQTTGQRVEQQLVGLAAHLLLFVALVAGDLVYVPRSGWGNINIFAKRIRPLLELILWPARVVNDWDRAYDVITNEE